MSAPRRSRHGWLSSDEEEAEEEEEAFEEDQEDNDQQDGLDDDGDSSDSEYSFCGEPEDAAEYDNAEPSTIGDMCFTSASESDSTFRTTDLSQEGDSSSSSDDDDDDKGNNSSSGGGSSDGGSPSRRTTPHDDGCITAALEIKSKFSADLIQ